MINFFPLNDPRQSLYYQVPLNAILVFRIRLKSAFIAPAVIQPFIDDWVNNSGDIIPVQHKILPGYLYLAPGKTESITITLKMPVMLVAGDTIFSTIHFSGFKDCSSAININFTEAGAVEDQILERHIEIVLPQTAGSSGENGHSAFQVRELNKVIGGMAALEVIPAKWLVAELVLVLIEKGFNAANTPAYAGLSGKLMQTRLYKNGVLILSGSQFIHWVMFGLSVSSGVQAVMGREKEAARMLYTWEQWLLGLADADIEAPDYDAIGLQFPQERSYEAVLEKVGMEPEKWLLYLVLGLMEVSPRIHAIIKQVCEKMKPPRKTAATSSKKKVRKVTEEKGSLQR